MFEDYPKFFGYLNDRHSTIKQGLGDETFGFSSLLVKHPAPGSEHFAVEYEEYLRKVIRYGLERPALTPMFAQYFEERGMLRHTQQGLKIYLNPAPAKIDIAFIDVRHANKSWDAVYELVGFLEPALLSRLHRGIEWGGSDGTMFDLSGVDLGVESVEAPAYPPATAADIAPASAAGPTPKREFVVTGHELKGTEVTTLQPEATYQLRMRVAFPVPTNLASGNTVLDDIPPQGLDTRWVVTSSDVTFVPELSTCSVEQQGATWKATFDLFIPATGDSTVAVIGITTRKTLGEIHVAIAALGTDKHQEVYRQLLVDLSAGARVSRDTTITAAAHTLLQTTHEWTTPPMHAQVRIWKGDAHITMLRGAAIKDYSGVESWSANNERIAGVINNVRISLEKLRDQWGAYLNDLDPDDMATRLQGWGWTPDSTQPNGWEPLPDGTDAAHRTAFETMQKSKEWQSFASDCYSLYDASFKKGSILRDMLEHLMPGSRIDFIWTGESGPGWVPHVPWALMCMSPPDLSGTHLIDPERFLGLRYRIGSHAWTVSAPSRALGMLDKTNTLNLLYWGDKAGDEVGGEARWQAEQFEQWGRSHVPKGTQPDPKEQVVLALDDPMPAPVGILYFYCHCNVGEGSNPILRFGNTDRSEDTIKRNELSQRELANGPFVFANACMTVQADPHITGLLEDIFFRRGIRAFLGTETKVPAQLASKFAWLFFQFFYRRIDPDPMAAGEALTQARMFLWTQYKNIGGLFYSLVNQYDLYLASDQEVVNLRQ